MLTIAYFYFKIIRLKYIDSKNLRLEIGDITSSTLSEKLSKDYAESKKVIIVDENTHVNCLEYLITSFQELSEAEIILLPPGEENKQLHIVESVWEALTDYSVSRHDLIINLGGGMITDIGGFIASCYKRGCDFINIPTSLLAIVDASIGGKTGVNLGHFKNQIGVFSDPVSVYIDPIFLGTLPEMEMLSGYAEMLKHGLISDKNLFDRVIDSIKTDEMPPVDLIIDCIKVKNEVVSKDPTEQGVRKILNFGHTIGHVLEGHFMTKNPMTHGHCVAIGMVMEAYISTRLDMIPEVEFKKIQLAILEFYQVPLYSNDEVNEMVAMLYNDKKNHNGKIRCALIDGIGSCVFDVLVPESMFVEVFLHFKNLQINMN